MSSIANVDIVSRKRQSHSLSDSCGPVSTRDPGTCYWDLGPTPLSFPKSLTSLALVHTGYETATWCLQEDHLSKLDTLTKLKRFQVGDFRNLNGQFLYKLSPSVRGLKISQGLSDRIVLPIWLPSSKPKTRSSLFNRPRV